MLKTKTRPASINRLEQEVARLRSFIVSLAGQDEEGAYRPEFVDSVLRASKEKPTLSFSGSANFLKQIKAV